MYNYDMQSTTTFDAQKVSQTIEYFKNDPYSGVGTAPTCDTSIHALIKLSVGGKEIELGKFNGYGIEDKGAAEGDYHFSIVRLSASARDRTVLVSVATPIANIEKLSDELSDEIIAKKPQVELTITEFNKKQGIDNSADKPASFPLLEIKEELVITLHNEDVEALNQICSSVNSNTFKLTKQVANNKMVLLDFVGMSTNGKVQVATSSSKKDIYDFSQANK
ncbi:hypothetical protein AB9G26_08765 [Francisella philomiragia]|uniref:hypothetical protein n=1 Tax=Francisella philomiragia TaxID=28110 RepID=UPI00351409EE